MMRKNNSMLQNMKYALAQNKPPRFNQQHRNSFAAPRSRRDGGMGDGSLPPRLAAQQRNVRNDGPRPPTFNYGGAAEFGRKWVDRDLGRPSERNLRGNWRRNPAPPPQESSRFRDEESRGFGNSSQNRGRVWRSTRVDEDTVGGRTGMRNANNPFIRGSAPDKTRNTERRYYGRSQVTNQFTGRNSCSTMNDDASAMQVDETNNSIGFMQEFNQPQMMMMIQ